MIDLYNGDCLEILKTIKDKSVDLIVTDPPYQIDNTKAGGKSDFARSFQKVNDQLEHHNLTNGFNKNILDEFVRVVKNINIYIWCNKKQIPMYIDYFVNKHKSSFDIIIWNKKNAVPTFNNKYLTDKEYCLYFRKGGYCNPKKYEKAKTVYYQPINAKDKKLFNHPTIKPFNIIKTIIENSSREGDVVLDPFMGSGTTGAACAELGRSFIGVELDQKYFYIAKNRIEGKNGGEHENNP